MVFCRLCQSWALVKDWLQLVDIDTSVCATSITRSRHPLGGDSSPPRLAMAGTSPPSSFPLPLPPPPPLLPGVTPLTYRDAAASFSGQHLKPPSASPAPADFSRMRIRSEISVPDRSGLAKHRIDGDGWQLVGGKKKIPGSQQRRPINGVFRLRELLLRKARGKCFRCLSSDHRIRACRNPAVCLLCGDLGHKARWCTNPRAAPLPQAPPPRRGPAPTPPDLRRVPPPPSRGPAPTSATVAAAPPHPRPVPPLPSVISSSPKFTSMAAPGGVRGGVAFATAARNAMMAEAERSLTRLAVVAVVIGHWPNLELSEVMRAFAVRFGIAEEKIKVTWRTCGELLIRFSEPADRDRVVAARGPHVFGQISFALSPWSRFRKAEVSHMWQKIRVCLEGVPESAWDWETVKPLFGGKVLFDEIDTCCYAEKESACFKVWVWTKDVDKLATRGVLTLEEPAEVPFPHLHFPELEIMAEEQARLGPVKLLDHPILIHLDRVHVFNPSPASSLDSGLCDSSVISGLPSDGFSESSEVTKWHYNWHLGYEAGSFPPSRPRGPVHSRLQFPGDHRDRDGPNGGSQGRRSDHGQASRGSRWDMPPATHNGQAGPSSAGGPYKGGCRRPASPSLGDMLASRQERAKEGCQAMASDGQKRALEGCQSSATELEEEETFRVPATLQGDVHGFSLASPGSPRLCVDSAGAGPLLSPVHDPMRAQELDGATAAPPPDEVSALAVDASLALTAEEVDDGPPTPGLVLTASGPPMDGGSPTAPAAMLVGSCSQTALVPSPSAHLADLSPRPVVRGLLDILEVPDHAVSPALADFANSIASPVSPPLLGPPSPLDLAGRLPAQVLAGASPGPEGRPSPLVTTRAAAEASRCSGRLAAKPSAGLSTMDKVHLVLLKKNGTPASEIHSKEDGLQKYREIYKKPLAPSFISAVNSLLEANAPASNAKAKAKAVAVGEALAAA